MGSRTKDWVRSHRPHIAGSVLLAAWLMPVLWFALAYGGLPRLWSHHERKTGKRDGDAVSYTAQDIPGDPINLEIHGDQAAIECNMRKGGWFKADPVSVRSGLQIATSVLLDRAYPNAPISPLYVHDQPQDIGYERDEGKSADRRHHVRFWQVTPGVWLGSATFDKGVGLSLFTLQITHHIGPDVDKERDVVEALLSPASPGQNSNPARSAFARPRRNGGGDRYQTDGRIALIAVVAPCRI